MKSSLIGSGDAQEHIRGVRAPGTGYGGTPSLPTHLRNFNPLDGPARAGVILPGLGTPLSVKEAGLLNRHFGLLPAGPLPPNEGDLGAFLAAVDGEGYSNFGSWLRGEKGRVYLFRALLAAHADHSDLGIGLHDIADVFGSPGVNNFDLLYMLKRWARCYPVVRHVLDGVVEKLRAEGRIPHADGTTRVTT